ncbi:MAG: AAA-like domain-containing protein [Candidatus Poribacteria bacterium]|nr:AAA-like domain-containing protein [Candidatus Poribacteria bacterium]
MKTFSTYGPVNPQDHYVVSRTEELADFINRVKLGRYIVIFAPRQTGKTTFFQWALDSLATDTAETYFPIELNFEVYEDYTTSSFYASLYRRIYEEIKRVFEARSTVLSSALSEFLENTKLTDHVAMLEFFQQFAEFLGDEKLILIVDEFDGIPRDALRGFLRSLRTIYVHRSMRKCPYSVGIVGVKNVTQLNLDRSISPFNIQDEFTLPNFTLEQVRELLTQYTDEVSQTFAPEVIENIHRQTAGQPFLVNRFAQILTEEVGIPRNETIQMAHFAAAHTQLLEETNANISHLLTNIRRNPRFESILMRIASYEAGIRFNPDDAIIDELTTYGVIRKGSDRMCEILNPIYQQRIMQAFKPIVNGLEHEYFPEDTQQDFVDYLTSMGRINMDLLLDNFRDFIACAGFRILLVPNTPKEFVGQYLLYAYLDQFVQLVHGHIYLEGQTGRGKIDLAIFHNAQKYIVETKIWEGQRHYEAGKKQLAAYLKLEGVGEGYYVVFDHRTEPEPRVETETIDGLTIRSYVIPVVQEVPSQQT